jgi:uncharacterized protein YggU (UPF0235/DUF167 family)
VTLIGNLANNFLHSLTPSSYNHHMFPPTLQAAIRLSKITNTIILSLRVKPGVSPTRAGIASTTPHWIHVNVCSRAQDGAANKAVTQLLAETLKVARSDVRIVRGEKSAEKVVEVVWLKKGTGDGVEYVRGILEGSVIRPKGK